jgi:hypothetical protein
MVGRGTAPAAAWADHHDVFSVRNTQSAGACVRDGGNLAQAQQVGRV